MLDPWGLKSETPVEAGLCLETEPGGDCWLTLCLETEPAGDCWLTLCLDPLLPDTDRPVEDRDAGLLLEGTWELTDKREGETVLGTD